MSDLKERLDAASRLVSPAPEGFERLAGRRERARRRQRVRTALVALLLAAGAVGGAVLAFGGFGRTAGSPGSTTDDLLVAAPGQYYYSSTLIYARDDPCNDCSAGRLLGPWTFEQWFGPDGSGRERFVDAPGPKGSIDYGWSRPQDHTYGPGGMPYEDLSDLPTDPTELAAKLGSRSGSGGASPNPIATSSPGRTQEDTSLLRTLQDLFEGGEQFTPPLVRTAMYEVARTMRGVRVVTGTVDPQGRPAVSLRWIVRYEGPPSEVEWFFDPDTKQFMGQTWTEGGLILEARIVVRAGIAGSTEGPPQGQALFFPEGKGSPTFIG